MLLAHKILLVIELYYCVLINTDHGERKNFIYSKLHVDFGETLICYARRPLKLCVTGESPFATLHQQRLGA